MSNSIGMELGNSSVSKSYVVEGATLTCSLGTVANRLQIPNGHNIYINGKKQANIADDIGGANILSFGPCHRSEPPPPCIMATGSKWVNGKENVYIDDEPAVVNTSVNFCSCGGVISIVDDGQ